MKKKTKKIIAAALSGAALLGGYMIIRGKKHNEVDSDDSDRVVGSFVKISLRLNNGERKTAILKDKLFRGWKYDDMKIANIKLYKDDFEQ